MLCKLTSHEKETMVAVVTAWVWIGQKAPRLGAQDRRSWQCNAFTPVLLRRDADAV